MEQPRLNLASHKAILEVVIDNVASGWLHGDDAHFDFFVSARALGLSLGDAKEVSPGWSSRVAPLVQFPNFIDVGAFSIDICEFPDKWRVSVVSGLLQGSCLDLTNDSNLVTSGYESFRMDGQPMDGNTG